MMILVGDDDPLVSWSLKVFLSRKADIWVLATASGGERALAVYERNLPDTLLTELRMPGMDGITASSAAVPGAVAARTA